jgi:hypothetical protein
MSDADQLARMLKLEGHRDAMLQAYTILLEVASSTGHAHLPQVQKALDYLKDGNYKSGFTSMWRAPERRSSLKKLDQSARMWKVRYSATPAGETRGEFIRVDLERRVQSNLIHATSPDLPALLVAKQHLGDVLADLPAAIGRIVKGYQDCSVTVERVDWPVDHLL